MEFTHLHVHTGYSLLDGAAKIKELVHRAKELGYDSLAITDHGVMYGVIEFYNACKEEGIKPILGCEVYVSPGSRFDRDKNDDRYYHLVLLAENDTGYHNLSKIVTRGFTEGFYYKPRVDMEVLKEYHEGVIALSACIAGEVAMAIRKGDYELAKSVALRYQDIFGKGNYFLEMQDHGMPVQATVNAGIMRLSKELDIPMVVTNDTHYINQEDWEAHDILLCIQTNKKVNDETRIRYEKGQFYLKSKEEMAKVFPYALEALENTHKIAERCNVEIVFGEQKFPKFTVPEGYTAESYLDELVYKGMETKYIQNGVAEQLKQSRGIDVKERVDYELSVIKQMGFVDYFLIVWDFLRFARDSGIAVGPGRGSAVGSVVSYCLSITNIEPLKYDLLFERFLNPERVSMPDIDIDFCTVRRSEVMDYCIEKYGEKCVTQIIAFQTMGARNVVRDVGRALDIPYAVCDTLAKAIPAGPKVTIDMAMESSKDFQDMYNGSEEIKRLVDIAKRLEGLPRNAGMHAAGVVIGAEPIENYVPLSVGAEGAVVTQFEKTTVESLGMLKMDFLALRTATVIQDTLRLIKETTGEDIDIDNIDCDDKNILGLMGQGKTEGMFQLESRGMKNFFVKLNPQTLDDVIAGVALFRPGPMQFIDDYVKCKENAELIHYDTPELKEILEPTYGSIIYQEQVMQIVMKLAGYTMGRSDLVRRAMSKKNAKSLEQERKNFVYGDESQGVCGCVANGVSEEIANKIFDEMMMFAAYAFNKSHSVAYAILACQTAYLKYYYPVEFMAATMSSVMGNKGKIANYINVCKQMGVTVLPPNINEGESVFTISDGKIRYGLSGIKSVGIAVTERIVAERTANGRFRDLRDFLERMSAKDTNKKTVEALILSGAFDGMVANRRQMMLALPALSKEAAQERKNRESGQMSLMDFLGEDFASKGHASYPDVEEYSDQEKLSLEKSVLGIYVSGHPLDKFTDVMEKMCTAQSTDFIVEQNEDGGESDEGDSEISASLVDGAMYVIGGLIDSVDVKLTRKNQNMAFVTLEDMVGQVNVVVFSREFEKYKDILKTDAKLFIKGRAQVEEKESRLIAASILTFDEAVEGKEFPAGGQNQRRNNFYEIYNSADYNWGNSGTQAHEPDKKASGEKKTDAQIWVLFENEKEFDDSRKDFESLLKKSPGYCPVFVQLRQEHKLADMDKAYMVDENSGILNVLQLEYGKDKVILRKKNQ
jgi:DNA polymerase-3 subunit alpha